MFANLFGAGTARYSGSNLERLLQQRVAQVRSSLTPPEGLKLFVRALQRERPDTLERIAEPDREAFAHGLAKLGRALIATSTGAAQFYGKQIDELSATHSIAALAVANCLCTYADALNISPGSSEGGYNYFGTYLILRKSMGILGILGIIEPWEKSMAAMDLTLNFSEDITDQHIAALLTPAAQAHVEQVIQGVSHFKSTAGLMPPEVASMVLSMALDNPQMFAPGQAQAQFGHLLQGGGLPGGGYRPSGPGPAGMAAAQALINAGINPYK